MSNRRRPKNVDQPGRWPADTSGGWPDPLDGEIYCAQTAVVADTITEPEALDYARKATHDLLMDQVGDRQRSGIWWSHHQPGEDAMAIIDALFPADDPDSRVQQVRTETLEWLVNGAAPVLVVAWCIGEVPEGLYLELAGPDGLPKYHPTKFDDRVTEYLRSLDEVPHHFQLHLMHAVEILGYKHPDKLIRDWWKQVYGRLVHDMHLFPETEEQLDQRLGDSREGWLARGDVATND